MPLEANPDALRNLATQLSNTDHAIRSTLVHVLSLVEQLVSKTESWQGNTASKILPLVREDLYRAQSASGTLTEFAGVISWLASMMDEILSLRQQANAAWEQVTFAQRSNNTGVDLGRMEAESHATLLTAKSEALAVEADKQGVYKLSEITVQEVTGLKHWASPFLQAVTEAMEPHYTPWEQKARLLLKSEEERSKEPPPMPVQEQNYESAESNAEKWSKVPQAFMYGVGYSFIQSAEGLVNAVKHPVKTMYAMAAITNTGSPTDPEYIQAEINLDESYQQTYDDFVNGDVLQKSFMLGDLGGQVGQLALTDGIGEIGDGAGVAARATEGGDLGLQATDKGLGLTPSTDLSQIYIDSPFADAWNGMRTAPFTYIPLGDAVNATMARMAAGSIIQKEIEDLTNAKNALRTPEGTGGIPEGTGELSNVETRIWYKEQMAKIPELMKQGKTLEDKARIAFDWRNQIRTEARLKMADKELAQQLFQDRVNLTWDQVVTKAEARGLTGDEIWQYIIDSAQRSNPQVDQMLLGK